MTKLPLILLSAGILSTVANQAGASTIQIRIQNISPQNGSWIMRPWIGLHDGQFQTYTTGQAASSGIQHIAEDGVSGDVSQPALLSGPPNICSGDASVYNPSKPCMVDLFNSYAGGSQQATIGGPTSPGNTLVKTFTVDPSNLNSKYLSFIVMVIPSNDAFFGTDSAHPIRIYDAAGKFNGGKGPIRLAVARKDIMDAGTEVNTESHPDTAFFGQSVAGTGTHPDTNAVVHVHPGFGTNIVNGVNMYPASQLNSFSLMNAGFHYEGERESDEHGKKEGQCDSTKGGYIAEVTITELP